MSERLDFALELKAVDAEQRLIEGYASVFGNLDNNGDVIDPGAFTETLAGRDPGDIGVFINHKHDEMPVGLPLVVREDSRGLYTKTRIYATAAGNDLLEIAKTNQAAGRGLGMSIGYKPTKTSFEVKNGQHVRHIGSLELGEFSYVVPLGIPANPAARVLAVKKTEAKADVDNSGWDGNAAMTACETASDYEAICAGRREGDPSLRSTWALPHHKSPGAPPNADGVRNSLSRLPQTQGLINKAAAQSHLDRHMAAINPDASMEGKAGRTFSAANAAKAKSLASSLRDLADQIDSWVDPGTDEEPTNDAITEQKDDQWLDLEGEQMALELAVVKARGGNGQ